MSFGNKFSTYRKIQPLLVNVNTLDHSAVQDFVPDIRMIDPSLLFVDEKYQRNVSKRSLKLVKKIIKEWSWSAFKPPIVTEYEDGNLYVLDGQHTSIAAATHPYINQIPVFVVKTFEEKERADAFIRHNVDRTQVTDIQLFKARLEAGEDDATSINMALQRAGVTLTQNVNQNRGQVGELSCLKTLEVVYNKRGLMRLRQILDICVAAKLSPIHAHYIVALDNLLHDEKHKNKFDPEGLTLTIRGYPYAKLSSDIEYKSRVESIRKKDIATILIKEAYETRFS